MKEAEIYAQGVSDGINIMKIRLRYLSFEATKKASAYSEYQEIITGKRCKP